MTSSPGSRAAMQVMYAPCVSPLVTRISFGAASMPFREASFSASARRKGSLPRKSP